MSNTNISSTSSIGRNWADVRKGLFTKEEIAESDLRVALIGELIKARKEQGISQRELEELRKYNSKSKHCFKSASPPWQNTIYRRLEESLK